MNASQKDDVEVGGLENENPMADPNPIRLEEQAGPQVEDLDIESLTPLQTHYLESLRQLIVVKNDYQSGSDYETWMMESINRSIYSALRDCIEANIGTVAKDLLHREHQVN